MDPPPPLTPKSFVKSLKGKDLRYHVAPGEDESSLDKLPPLPDGKPDDLRRYYPVDKEALDRAWDQLAGAEDDFIWETVKRLRYKLKDTGYLQKEHGYIFPHPYENRYHPLLSNDFDWMDHESEIEEPAGRDEDGRRVYYEDTAEFSISPPEDRKRLKLDYDSSDASEISDDPDHGLVPGLEICWSTTRGVK